MKQIGVKKAIGASRKALIIQFLSESMVLTLLSGLLSMFIVRLLLPHFNFITGKELIFDLNINLIMVITAVIIITGFIAGSYPAFYLSGFKPTAILKGKLDSSISELWVRKGLVLFQFSLSVIFIVAVIIINKQMEYAQIKNLGYNRDNVLYFQGANQKYDLDVFFAKIQEIPGVMNATNIHGGSIVNNPNRGSGFSWEGEKSNENFLFMRPQVGYDFFETLGIELKEGRTFSKEYSDESSKLIVNEAAAEMIGYENIIGKMISDGGTEKQIVGVVQNFNIKSLHEGMAPCIIRFVPKGQHVMVKIKAGAEKVTIDQLEEIYKEFHPAYPFEFSFLNEDYHRLYVAESRMAVLSKYFSGLAIIISCLGLFGLATFAAERRTKEIGIRKILGSSLWGIVKMLSADFTKMVFVAILIALPISYLIAQRWLENFAYKIEMQWWFFASAAFITLLIAWLTVGFQTLKAANVNPVECLRDE